MILVEAGTASGSCVKLSLGRKPPCTWAVPGACCTRDAGVAAPVRGMILMNLIRRVLAPTAATAVAVLVTVAASACGGATTATSTPTNGLEKKSPADVLQAAAAGLRAATSVHVVGTAPNGHLDARMQHGSATGTFTVHGHRLRVTIVGGTGYINT